MHNPGSPFKRQLVIIACCLLTSWVLWACSSQPEHPIDPFLPPTSLALPETTSRTASVVEAGNEATATAASTATPACTNNLSFLDDLTIPDGLPVQPGETLDKRWKVENSGTCNWNKQYRLRLIAGPEMGVPPDQALFPARGGSQAIIRIQFTAPLEAGTYRSAWQASDSQGNPFGDPFFIEISVTP